MTDDRGVTPFNADEIDEVRRLAATWREEDAPIAGGYVGLMAQRFLATLDAAVPDDRSVAPHICPACGLPKWPGREDFSRMSAEQINAYLAGTGNDVRVMPDAAAPDELRAAAKAVVDANWSSDRDAHEQLAKAIVTLRAALRPAGAPEPGE